MLWLALQELPPACPGLCGCCGPRCSSPRGKRADPNHAHLLHLSQSKRKAPALCWR